jgi:hypothetical protein
MKNKFISFIVLLLFIIAPFIQSNTSDESQPDVLLNLPPIISVVAFYARWGIFIILALYLLITKQKISKYVTKYNVLFALFYLVPFLYSLVTFTDVGRYTSLFLLSIILPVAFTSQFQENKGYLNLDNFEKIVYLFVATSIVVSFNTTIFGLRFQGILGNANMYGISAVFWLALIQLCKKTKLNLILTIIIFITIILSGSRGSFLACIVVIFFSYATYIKKLLIGSVLAIIGFASISRFVNLEFIYGRFEGISNSASESGRQGLWDLAFRYIDKNPLGNGMNAPLELIKSGNIHNCYVRFLLTMGYPFTIVTLCFFFILVILAVKDKKIPRPLSGFLLGYAIANFGEDFFVGVGSSMFVYVIMAIGLLSYYNLKK